MGIAAVMLACGQTKHTKQKYRATSLCMQLHVLQAFQSKLCELLQSVANATHAAPAQAYILSAAQVF
jgi:hypothetical protein